MAESRDQLFVHSRMQNPTKQIRLLQPRPDHGGLKAFSISDWDLKSAPPFTAISYTWGPVVLRSVLINGRVHDIRNNCWYALWQASLHARTNYIWIDSICIDQDSIDEKNAQVARMYGIYRRATEVVSCIGPHQNCSELLVAITSAMEPLLEAAAHFTALQIIQETLRKRLSKKPENVTGNVRRAEPVWISIFTALGLPTMTAIVAMLQALEERPYWKRLWILQEVFAGLGNNNLRILVGHDCINMQALKRFIYILSLTEDHPSFPELVDANDFRYLSRITVSSNVRPSLRSIFVDFRGDQLCFDPRDRLFGMLSLVRRDDKLSSGVVVDYRKSAMDLALQMTSFLGFDVRAVAAILTAFGFDAEHAEIKRLVLRYSEDPANSITGLLDPQNEKAPRLKTEIEGSAARLMPGPNGNLTVEAKYSRMRRQNDISGLADDIAPKNRMPSVARYMALLAQRSKSEAFPKQVISGGRVVAFVTSAAEPGDIMLEFPTGSSGYMDLVLVLRHSQDDKYAFDIVGQGFLLYRLSLDIVDTVNLQDCECADAAVLDHGFFEAKGKLSISAEEVLAYLGQDYMGQERWMINEWRFTAAKRSDRLYHTPMSRRKNAVNMSVRRCLASHERAKKVQPADRQSTSREELSECTEQDDNNQSMSSDDGTDEDSEHMSQDHTIEDSQEANESDSTRDTADNNDQDGAEENESDFEDSSNDDQLEEYEPSISSSSGCSEDEETKLLPLPERYRRWQIETWQRR